MSFFSSLFGSKKRFSGSNSSLQKKYQSCADSLEREFGILFQFSRQLEANDYMITAFNYEYIALLFGIHMSRSTDLFEGTKIEKNEERGLFNFFVKQIGLSEDADIVSKMWTQASYYESMILNSGISAAINESCLLFHAMMSLLIIFVLASVKNSQS